MTSMNNEIEKILIPREEIAKKVAKAVGREIYES